MHKIDSFEMLQQKTIFATRCGDFNQLSPPPIFRVPWTIFIVVRGTPFL